MSRSLEIKELKNGAVRMAREAEVPLIPMIVFGGHRVLSYDVRDFTQGADNLHDDRTPDDYQR